MVESSATISTYSIVWYSMVLDCRSSHAWDLVVVWLAVCS